MPCFPLYESIRETYRFEREEIPLAQLTFQARNH